MSVPFDCSSQKVRCCRFKVLDKTPISDLAPTDRWHDDLTYGDGGCGSCNCSGDEDDRDRGYDDGYDACLEAIDNGDVDPNSPSSDPDCFDVERCYGDGDYTEEYEDGFFDGWHDALDEYEPDGDGNGDEADDTDTGTADTGNGGVSSPDDAKLQDAIDEASSAAVAAFNEAMSKLRGGNA